MPIRLDISKKVAVPTAVLAATGAVLLIAGALTGDATLSTWGGAILAASGVGGVLGYNQPNTTDEHPAAKEIPVAVIDDVPADVGDAGIAGAQVKGP